MADEKQTTEPHDRLTRICDAMTKTMDLHPEKKPDDKAIVFIDSDADQRGGLVMHGYTDSREAMVNLFMHMRAVFKASGMDLEFIGIPDDPSGLTDGCG